MKNTILVGLIVFSFVACTENNVAIKENAITTNGQMPALVKDNSGTLHIVYGNGDSIMYIYSKDNGNTFSAPYLIKQLPKVYTYAMRGPQIAATNKGIIVIACTSNGNIYSFYKENGKNWIEGNRVNDADTVCKEGLIALSGDRDNAFAAWLDLRGNQRNKIYGARSVDGGKTWSRNILIYASPDSSVCECCKPSVVVRKNKVAVMFRNWLNGNRDLYLIQSGDAGNTFEEAQKLGVGSWKLNGCPMDGGNLIINNKGEVQTVWRREATVYLDNPGMPEKEIGKGKDCTLETLNNQTVYAWMENDSVVVIKPNGERIVAGKGSQPVLKAIDNNHFICLWQNNKQIHAGVFEL
jgi:Neuraminidase (sialidase)